jgi:hypothetical protein
MLQQHLDASLLRLPHMVANRRLGSARIARLDRLNNCTML